MLCVYIEQLLEEVACGHHVYHVTLKQLQNISKSIVCLKTSSKYLDKKFDLQAFDKFSHLKSLGKYI